MASRSRCNCTADASRGSAGSGEWSKAGRAGRAGEAGRDDAQEAAVNASAMTADPTLFRNLIDRLHDVGEVGGIGLRGARLARTGGVDVAPGLPERDLVGLLAPF